MYGTLNMMRQIITGKEKDTDEKELIKEYQGNSNPSILAYFYVEHFGVIQRASNMYNLITAEDKASYCLQELDKSLHTYKLDSSNLFITYFSKCYKNRLRMETEQLQTLKRKANIIIENIYEYSDTLSYSDEVLLDSYDLTEREKLYCELKESGYSIKEIAHLLKLSIARIYEINDIIKGKILRQV